MTTAGKQRLPCLPCRHLGFQAYMPAEYKDIYRNTATILK